MRSFKSLYNGLALGLSLFALSLGSIYCGGSSGGGSSGGSGTKNKAPVVTILSPKENSSFKRGTDVALDGIVRDFDNGDSIVDEGWDLGGLTNNITGTLTKNVTVPLNASLGNYEFAAYGIDNHGARGESYVTINVLNNPPVANAGNDISVPKNIPFDIDATKSYDVDGTINKCELDLEGDGIYEVSNTTCFFGIGGYPFDSCLNSSVKVTDNNNATSTDTVKIQVGSGICP